MKNLSYNEAKKLLLQGVDVKLPEWEGYWRFDTEEKQIFAHLKSGGIVPAQAIYTLNENWEVATVDNCPVLKKELEAKMIISNGKILKILPKMVKGRRDLIILFKSGMKIVEINHLALCDLVGFEEAKRMIRNHMEEDMLQDFPEEVRDMVKDLFKTLDEACDNIVNEIEKENKNK